MSFPCFSVSCLLLIDLEEFYFSQGSLVHMQFVCCAPGRLARGLGLSDNCPAWRILNRWPHRMLAWLDQSGAKWVWCVLESAWGMFFLNYTELQNPGLILERNQDFLFWALYCAGFSCDQQSPSGDSSHGISGTLGFCLSRGGTRCLLLWMMTDGEAGSQHWVLFFSLTLCLYIFPMTSLKKMLYSSDWQDKAAFRSLVLGSVKFY